MHRKRQSKKRKYVYKHFSTTKHIETKADAVELVTEYDRRVEEIFFKNLKEKFPTHR